MIIDRICTRNQLCLEILVVYCPFSLDSSLHGSDQRHAIILEDHSQVTQLLQRGMNTSDRMWNKTFSESNVVGPRLGHQQSTQRFSVRVSVAHSNHHGMAQSSTVCFLILPRLEGSIKRLVRPVQSTIGLFKNHVLAIRKLVKEFTPGAVYPHTFRENRSQTKIGHDPAVTRNNCVRVVLSRGAVFQTWRQTLPATRSALLQRPTLHHQGEKVVELLCPFQRYMHDTMEQKELEPTSATPQLHNWAIRWLNLQLSLSSTIAAAE